MTTPSKLSTILVIAVFSFLGGMVGGGLSQFYLSDGIAKDTKKKNAQFGLIKADLLIAKGIAVNAIDVIDKNGKPVGRFQDNGLGGSTIGLGYHDVNTGKLSPMLVLGAGPDGSIMIFKDTVGNDRIVTGVNEQEPSIKFKYGGHTRLRLGTNHIAAMSTGNMHTYKGSIFSFDRKDTVTGRFPATQNP